MYSLLKKIHKITMTFQPVTVCSPLKWFAEIFRQGRIQWIFFQL